MGNSNARQTDQTSVAHFSHPHPLYLTNLQTSAQILQCSACKLDASGSIYTCRSCNFVLHQNCYQLPQKIKHSFHQDHTLHLQPNPVYHTGLFRCDACGNPGSGFSYHCSACSVDLHTTCASLPPKLTYLGHHHRLHLTFAVPYHGNMFTCNVCRRVGSETWIYRCDTCGFDAHLTCVATVIPAFSPLPPHMVAYSGAPGMQNVVIGQTSNPYNNLNHAAYGPARPVIGGGIGNQLLVGVMDGMGSGVAQAAQVLIQGSFGGGGDSGGGGGNGGSYYDGGGNGGFSDWDSSF